VYKTQDFTVTERFSFAAMKFFRILFLFFSLPVLAQKPAQIQDYIASFRQLAIAEQMRTGIPASITMAQAIHESGAGQGDLALKSNNHFGIKCKSDWTGDVVYHDDDAAGECFRSYSSVEDSYRDHSDFLKAGKRYAFLFSLDPKDYSAWASGLKQAGYATNPKYPQIITRLIEENNLEELTETALQQNGNGNIWLASNKTSVTTTAKEEIDQPVREEPAKRKEPSKQAIFYINHCKAVFVPAGTSLRDFASKYKVEFSDLLDYNDLKKVEKLASNQVLFIQHKRKKGSEKTHEVQKGETTWIISQQEGIRLENLLAFNKMKPGTSLKQGQILKLR
jgi:LysM repeat protein